MMNMKAGTVLTAAQLQQHYGNFHELSPKAEFDPADVPDELVPLIPYAAFWGLSDDLDRENLVEAATPEITANLKLVIRENDDAIDAWLAGPLADKPPFSAAYIAFSAMRMAADYC
ncbi:hypothetical protein [Prosthecobacter fluviatilis]